MANPNDASGISGTTYFSDSAEKTRKIAAEIAGTLDQNAVVALRGDLGSGKTEFARGLVLGLGSNDPVTSPTFAIAHEYGGAAFPVYHFDFYRMEDSTEFETCGFEECVGSGLVIAEWADHFAERLPPQTLWVSIRVARDVQDAEIREITLKFP
jgi:tRNA threonylcarbamoyladenosine biosynthesis protein TsaE